MQSTDNLDQLTFFRAKSPEAPKTTIREFDSIAFGALPSLGFVTIAEVAEEVDAIGMDIFEFGVILVQVESGRVLFFC